MSNHAPNRRLQQAARRLANDLGINYLDALTQMTGLVERPVTPTTHTIRRPRLRLVGSDKARGSFIYKESRLALPKYSDETGCIMTDRVLVLGNSAYPPRDEHITYVRDFDQIVEALHDTNTSGVARLIIINDDHAADPRTLLLLNNPTAPGIILNAETYTDEAVAATIEYNVGQHEYPRELPVWTDITQTRGTYRMDGTTRQRDRLTNDALHYCRLTTTMPTLFVQDSFSNPGDIDVESIAQTAHTCTDREQFAATLDPNTDGMRGIIIVNTDITPVMNGHVRTDLVDLATWAHENHCAIFFAHLLPNMATCNEIAPKPYNSLAKWWGEAPSDIEFEPGITTIVEPITHHGAAVRGVIDSLVNQRKHVGVIGPLFGAGTRDLLVDVYGEHGTVPRLDDLVQAAQECDVVLCEAGSFYADGFDDIERYVERLSYNTGTPIVVVTECEDKTWGRVLCDNRLTLVDDDGMEYLLTYVPRQEQARERRIPKRETPSPITDLRDATGMTYKDAAIYLGLVDENGWSPERVYYKDLVHAEGRYGRGVPAGPLGGCCGFY